MSKGFKAKRVTHKSTHVAGAAFNADMTAKGSAGASSSGTSQVRTEDFDGALKKTVITFENYEIALADEAGVVAYGSQKLYDFPQGLIGVLGCLADLALTKSSAGVDADWNGDFGVGTAAADNDATLSGAEQDIIPSTATPEAVSGATTADGQMLPTSPIVDSIPIQDIKLPSLLEQAAAAATGVFGLVAGTHGSASATLVGEAASGASITSVGRILYKLPKWYKKGSAITVRVRAKVATGLANTSDSLDLQAYKIDKDAGVGSDLCETAAKTTLTTSYANYDYVITPDGLSAGDVLDLEITSVEDDTGGTTGSVITVSAVDVLVTQESQDILKFDGRSTAKDLYINFLVDDADHNVTATACNLILNGTLEFHWIDLGDN